MDFNTDSFHDTTIFSVTEYSSTHTIDFLIDYTVDWTNHIFDRKILRFSDVTYYLIQELPLAGTPTILDIVYKSTNANDTLGNSVTTIIIHTNAGIREVEYKAVELLNVG